MSTIDRFRAAVERRDPDAAAALMAPDVRLQSPLKPRTIGRRDVDGGFLAMLASVFPDDLRFTGHLTGTAEDPEQQHRETHMLPFTAAGHTAVAVLQLDDHGLIATLAVHTSMRASTAAISRILDGTVESQLAP